MSGKPAPSGNKARGGNPRAGTAVTIAPRGSGNTVQIGSRLGGNTTIRTAKPGHPRPQPQQQIVRIRSPADGGGSSISARTGGGGGGAFLVATPSGGGVNPVGGQPSPVNAQEFYVQTPREDELDNFRYSKNNLNFIF